MPQRSKRPMNMNMDLSKNKNSKSYQPSSPRSKRPLNMDFNCSYEKMPECLFFPKRLFYKNKKKNSQVSQRLNSKSKYKKVVLHSL